MRRGIMFGVIVAVAGCGGSTSTLTGTVSYQGKTVTSGSVIVANEDGTAVSGVIQPDGAYTVHGVKRGHVTIGVFSPEPAKARSIVKRQDSRPKPTDKSGKLSADERKAMDAGWFPIPRQYGTPGAAGIACDVTSAHVHFDIELK